MMAPTSSKIATESRNNRRVRGIRAPNTARLPITNAVSVAITMPHPLPADWPRSIDRNTRAGTTMPPRAAAIENNVMRGLRSSPSTISRFISSATTKKNSVIAPSLIQRLIERENSTSPKPMVMGVSQNAMYGTDHGELEVASATAAHSSSTTAARASMRRNRTNGLENRWTGSCGRCPSP